VHVVKLKILPRGNVRNSVGILFRQFRHDLKLIGIQSASGNLDALHSGRIPERVRTLSQIAGRKIQLLDLLSVIALPVVVALTISAAAQASLGEQAFLKLALLAQSDFGFEDINLARQMLRQLTVERFFPERV